VFTAGYELELEIKFWLMLVFKGLRKTTAPVSEEGLLLVGLKLSCLFNGSYGRMSAVSMYYAVQKSF